MQETPIQTAGPNIMPVKKSGAAFKVILTIIILAAVASGALLGTRVWDPTWNPFRPSPEKVIASMFEKMKDVKSSHSSVKMIADVNQEGGMSGKIKIFADVDSNLIDISNPQVQGNTQINVSGQGFDMSANVDMKMLNKEAYFNIKEINAPPLAIMFAMMGIDIDSLKGNWIKVPVTQPTGSQVQVQTLTPDQMANIQRIFSEADVFEVEKQMPDQVMDGQAAYHYLVVLNNANLAELMGKFIDESIKQIGDGNGTPEMEAAKGGISKFLNDLGRISVELFIGKKDNLLYGIKMNKNVDISTYMGSNSNASISFEEYYSKYNQPVIIQAPAIFKNIEDFISKGKL